MLLATVMVARAFDFSEAAPTGQMLFYTATSGNTVKVVSGAPKPTGRLTIPATVQGYAVTEIASMAFNGCTELTSVTVPGSVTHIGMRAFAGCSALTSAFLSEGVQTLGMMVFSNCTALETISLPTTLTQISAGCFGNTSLSNNFEHWQDSVLYISNYLVSSKPRTGILIVADGTIGIANTALDNCSITKCVIPEGLHFIGEQAFFRCSLLDTVQLLDTIPPALAANAFQNTPPTLTIIVPVGKVPVYRAAPNWSSLNIVEYTCPPQNPPVDTIPTIDTIPTVDTIPTPPVSLQTANGHQLTAVVTANILTVSGAEGQHISITDMAGRCIISTFCQQHDMQIALPAKGLYIVNVGTSAPLKIFYSR